MFARKMHTTDSFSKSRAGKAISKQKRSFRDNAVTTTTGKRTERARKVEAVPAMER